MGDYESWNNNCKTIKKQNKELLREFHIWLTESGLAKKTTKYHCENVKFYINNFLLYDDATPAKDGSDMIGMFLGYWFIKKTMWASGYSIKQNISSIRKFYKFMMEKGDTTPKQFDELKKIIKEEQFEWLETMNRYSDPDIDDMGEVWGI